MKRGRRHDSSKRKERKSNRVPRRKPVLPRSAEEFFARPEQFQDRWTRMTHAITKMKSDGLSLRQASREFELDARTVIRLGGSALRKSANGRYAPKRHDRLLRVLVVPTPNGLREIALRDSRAATQVAEYWVAVQRYIQTGDDSALRRFEGKQVTDVSGRQILLLTDIAELDIQANAGNMAFESLYARAS